MNCVHVKGVGTREYGREEKMVNEYIEREELEDKGG